MIRVKFSRDFPIRASLFDFLLDFTCLEKNRFTLRIGRGLSTMHHWPMLVFSILIFMQ